MKHVVSPLLRAARLIVPALVTAALLGGTLTAGTATAGTATAGTAATAAGAPSAAVTWHPITLANGWTSASKSTLLTGTPSYAISGGVVYLRGAVKQPNPDGSSIVAQLPKAAWPARNLYLQVFTNADVAGILYVGDNGTMEAYAGNADAFTSLSAVSYPAATMKVKKLTLEHGWVSSQPVYTTGDPSYAISGGVVYLSGSMHTGGTSRVVTLLPKAARPAHQMFVLVYTLDGTPGWLQILPTGQVEAFGPDAVYYTSLAGVSYPAAGAKWHTFALEDGWKSGQARFRTAAPAYTVIGGVVYLTGSMYEATQDIGLWASLPAAARTAADVLEIEVATSGGTAGAMAITDSLGLVSSMPFRGAQAFTSLDGIAYPKNS